MIVRCFAVSERLPALIVGVSVAFFTKITTWKSHGLARLNKDSSQAADLRPNYVPNAVACEENCPSQLLFCIASHVARDHSQ